MTSPISGSYSKGLQGGFDEDERLLLGLMQRAIPVVDADENRKEFQRYIWIRRALETVIGDASPNDGYKIVGDNSASDFQISGGDGTLNGAGRIWISGIHCFLKADIRYVNVGATSDELSIYPRASLVTGLGNIVLEDSSADYVVGSLVGRTINPDVTQPGVVGNIIANTARTITTDLDLTAAGVVSGSSYRVNMSVPVGIRTDGVYLNVSIEEVNGDEVPSIRHDLGTLLTAQLFARIRARIEIHEIDTNGLPGDLSTTYIDADGFEHFRIKIADIARTAAVALIDTPDVTERRFTSANFTNFLNKHGDTMDGDLNMQAADIVLDPGRLVDGRDVSVDGTKLDTITWSPQGIADQLKLSAGAVQPLNLVGVTTQVTNVSEQLRLREPRGDSTTKGVYTDVPNNRVVVFNSDDSDDFTDTNGNKVAGRLTEAHPFNGVVPNPTLSGSWTFVIAGFGVTGGGAGQALTELQVGDAVLGVDGVYYTVNVITTDNFFTVKEPSGASGVIANPPARRWELALIRNNSGSEDPAIPGADGVPASMNITWFVQEVFDLADRPVENPMWSVPSDQVAAEVPDASTAAKGKAQFAVDGGTAALTAVQGLDSRLGAVKGRADAGSVTGLNGTVRVIAGANISVGLVESGGELQFTITGSATASPLQSTSFGPSTFTWNAAATPIATGALAFNPIAAIGFGSWREGLTSTSAVSFGFATPFNSYSHGQNAEGSTDGNDMSSTYAQGSIGGRSGLGGVLNSGWTMAVNVNQFSMAGITLQPSLVSTGSMSLLILG